MLGFSATGCRTIEYYSQAARGQYQVLARRQSCEKLIGDTNTPAKLQGRLQTARAICDFANHELKLSAKGRYQKYADLGRPYVVWNVVATPQFSLEAKSWWYPVVGSLDYRGFFSEAAAQEAAHRLAKENYDTAVEGVEAYSTLGWFSDPLLNTFIWHGDTSLAETLFHELAHQRVFAAGDTDFNEAFATTVGQEGVRRWLRSKLDPTALARYEVGLKRNLQFVQLVAAARKKLEALYGDERDANGKIRRGREPARSTPADLQQEKERILSGLRNDYESLKQEWQGYTGYDDWFALNLNNAKLNSVATYYDLVPAFERLLASQQGELSDFYELARQLARLPKAERRRRLLAAPAPVAAPERAGQ